MTWSITLEVVDSASIATKIVGAEIKKGVASVGATDANGRFTATLDDLEITPIFKISKQDYISTNAVCDKETEAGTTKTVSMVNPNSIPDGQDPNIPGQSGGQEFDGGCFIVTATTGSASSFEVSALRNLREDIRPRSQIASRLIDRIYEDYVRFSPEIAGELRQNDTARNLALTCIVQPLFAWYRLAGLLALCPENRGDARDAQAGLEDACNNCPISADVIASLLRALREGQTLPWLDISLPDVSRYPFADWAILDPLQRLWKSPQAPADEIADWLCNAPIDGFLDAATPSRDITPLVGFLDFSPRHRRQFHSRIGARLPAHA